MFCHPEGNLLKYAVLVDYQRNYIYDALKDQTYLVDIALFSHTKRILYERTF